MHTRTRKHAFIKLCGGKAGLVYCQQPRQTLIFPEIKARCRDWFLGCSQVIHKLEVVVKKGEQLL